MLRNYLKIAFRNLVKSKGYSAINIGGLAVGMAVAMLIGLWVYDEFAFNRYHGNYDRIAKVVETLQHIEARITRFAAAIRAHDIPGPQSDDEAARAARRGRLLLHGPESDGAGALQAEVDALLAPDKPGGNTQADIDRLLA